MAVKSCDSYQAEKIKTVAKDEQIKEITITFTQTDKFWPSREEIIVILWIYSGFITITLFSAWDKSCDQTVNSQLLEQM